MQLSSRIRGRDLEDFFSVVCKIADVRIITDAKTRRSKGIAYVEFEDVESVPLVRITLYIYENNLLLIWFTGSWFIWTKNSWRANNSSTYFS